MADEPKETTGTPTPDGGDAQPTATTGTPAEDGRNASDGDERWKEALVWKAKAERLNEVEAKLAELEARQTPAADVSTDQVAAYYAEVERQAMNGTPWAIAEVRRLKLDAERDEALRILADALPPERKEVLKEYAQNRHKYGTPEAAAEALEARKLREKVQALEAENKRLSTNRVDPNVVPTATREGPAATTSTREMTRAEWLERQNSLDDDERRAEQLARIKGRIVVKG